MKRLVIFLLLVFAPGAATAQEQTRYEDYTKIVALGARIDAYNAYCKKETQLARALIAKAKRENLENPEGGNLEDIKKTVFDRSMQEFDDREAECKKVDFMLEKLDLMKMLKAAIIALNNGENIKDPQESVEAPADNPL